MIFITHHKFSHAPLYKVHNLSLVPHGALGFPRARHLASIFPTSRSFDILRRSSCGREKNVFTDSLHVVSSAEYAPEPLIYRGTETLTPHTNGHQTTELWLRSLLTGPSTIEAPVSSQTPYLVHTDQDCGALQRMLASGKRDREQVENVLEKCKNPTHNHTKHPTIYIAHL